MPTLITHDAFHCHALAYAYLFSPSHKSKYLQAASALRHFINFFLCICPDFSGPRPSSFQLVRQSLSRNHGPECD
jgi:hypothetical protein